MVLRTMLSMAVAASGLTALGWAGLHEAVQATTAGGGGIEIPSARPSGARSQPAPGVMQAYSHTWSGYEQAGTKAKVFTAVRGFWTVPTVKTGSGDQYSSDWVGIDGAGGTSTLIQDGSESDNIGGKAQYYAWTEIVPASPVVTPLAIKPGDEMEGLVWEAAINKWSLTVTDVTTGKSYTRTVSYTTPQQDVEAIHERPCIQAPCTSADDWATLASTTNVTQLPDYYSTAAPGKAPVWTVLGKTIPGAALDQWFMTNNKGTKIIASPSALNSAKDGFTIADGAKSPTPPPSWFATKVPLPSNATPDANLSAVACPSTSRCVAVGLYGQKPDGQLPDGLVLTGSGPSWIATEAPLPPNADKGVAGGLSLPAVACPSVSACVAVGTYIDKSGTQQAMVLTGSGSSWKATEVPMPSGLYVASISSIACPSVSVCVAVGSASGSAGSQGLLLTRSDASWVATAAPLPANAGSKGSFINLTSVACYSNTSCVAVGDYYDNAGNRQGMLLSGLGSSWIATEAPLPPGAQNSILLSVACSPVTGCAAVGQYTEAPDSSPALLVTGSGSSWQATTVPLPPNASANPGNALESVSCSLRSGCVAFGYYADTYNLSEGLLLTGSGSSWTAIDAPTPANGFFRLGDELLAGCTSTSRCVAAGFYADASNKVRGLLLTGFGTSWKPARVPLPPGAPPYAPMLSSVACTPTADCVVAGEYQDSSNHFPGFIAWGPS
jgi:hypothetical protein